MKTATATYHAGVQSFYNPTKHYMILIEKRMIKNFNETCKCNNGMDGDDTCIFVEKKYDLVKYL